MLDKKYTYLILAGLCFLVYANSLNNAFVSDDVSVILENPRLAYFWSYWPYPQDLLNSLIYRIAKFNVVPYHLTNIILHFLSTLLVFSFLRLFFKTESSFLAAALFAVHPAHTEAVTWISGRGHIILAIFTLITYLLYYRATDPNIKNKVFAYTVYILSLAIFSYFIIGNVSFYILLPFFIVFSDIILNRLRKNWKFWLPFLFIMALRLIAAREIIHERIAFALLYGPAKTEAWRNPAFPFIYSIFSHLWLLFWPIKLTFFHEPIVFYPKAMWLGFIALVIFTFFLPYLFKKTKSIFLGIGMFVLFLAPTYSPLPITSIVAERYAYLPSILLSIIAAFFYEKYTERPNGKRQILAIALFIFLIVVYGAQTIVRNTEWKDAKRLWTATLAISPYSPWAHNSMGTVCLLEGDNHKAIGEFNAALEINPELAEAYNNRGRAYQNLGDLNQAISDYTRAIQINPNFIEAYNNRGIAYKKKHEFDNAISEYNKAIKINPDYAEVYYNRGNAYVAKGKLNQALSDYDKAIQINPYAAQFYANRGAIYFIKQEYHKVWQDIQKAETLGYKFNPEFINKLKKAITTDK